MIGMVSGARAEVNDGAGESILQVVTSLFPRGVAVAAGSVMRLQEPLHPDERRAIAGAAPRRRRTFVAGRTCARRALARLDVAQVAIPRADDGSPIWPAGVVGSISHTDDDCAAVAGSTDAWTALGLDIEDAGDLPPELWQTVLTEEDEAWLGRRSREHRGRLATLLLSAKEAAYKCQHPSTRRLLAFRDVAVHVDLDSGSFAATAVASGAAILGRFGWSGGRVVTGARVPRPC